MNKVRIPQLTDLGGGITLYYSRIELSNADIKTLFGKHSSSTVAKLKDLVKNYMVEHDIKAWNPQRVNTKAAYAAWGLDINDLEERYIKLTELAKLA